ncbi:UTRA domain-containing protein [Streptomyces sp. NPDC058466]|uniref:UTRA domain-containing protein n=1 Tax=Streptomyces sp. NPDC058466 TaxID=3346512 RepID=UPI00365F2FF5
MTEAQWSGSSTPYLGSGQGDAWGKEAADQGRTGSQRILKAGPVAAYEAIAQRLGLPEGSPVVERQRLILLDGQPVELAISYWPANWAAETALAQPGRIRGGAVSLLAELGYTPGRVDEDVSTRPPTREEIQTLGLAAEEWILSMTRTITAPDGRPYEVSVMVSPGRIGRLHYSMKVD